jgi:hypothetical protein
MSLINDQAIFMQDVCRLISFSTDNGFIVTGGELFRTQEQQDIYVKTGKSKTMNSMHLKRCAIDLNFFRMIGSVPTLISGKGDLQILGDYWESLDKEKNQWGGNWKFLDIPHFERKV